MSDTTGETPSGPGSEDGATDPITPAVDTGGAGDAVEADAVEAADTIDVGGASDSSDTEATVLVPTDDRDDRDAPAATQIMPAPDHDAGAESRRVTRDELYARADRQGEQERLASLRAEHESAAAPAPPVGSGAGASAAGAAGTAGGAVGAAGAAASAKKLKMPRTTDKFFPSLGLFGLRITAAAMIGVHGVQKLLAMDQTAQFFGTLSLFGMKLPEPSILALLTGVAEVLISVALVVGFLTRIASFGMLLVAVGALLMVKMTVLPNPLAPGAPGFSGEAELLLAGTSLLLLCVGGGSWALDRLFRRGRYATADDLTD